MIAQYWGVGWGVKEHGTYYASGSRDYRKLEHAHAAELGARQWGWYGRTIRVLEQDVNGWGAPLYISTWRPRPQ